MTTLEFANHHLRHTNKNSTEEFEYWRNVQNLLLEHGADTSVLDKRAFKGNISQKVADTFAFWGVFSAPYSIIGCIMGMQAISDALENKWVDLNSHCFKCAVSLVVASCVYVFVFKQENQRNIYQIKDAIADPVAGNSPGK